MRIIRLVVLTVLVAATANAQAASGGVSMVSASPSLPPGDWRLEYRMPLPVGAGDTSAPSVVRRALPPGVHAMEGWQAPASTDGSLGWKPLAAAGTMVVSGVVAAHLKNLANREFATYEATLSSSSLNASRRYDRQSSAVFAATQISFALLAYFLLAD